MRVLKVLNPSFRGPRCKVFFFLDLHEMRSSRFCFAIFKSLPAQKDAAVPIEKEILLILVLKESVLGLYKVEVFPCSLAREQPANVKNGQNFQRCQIGTRSVLVWFYVDLGNYI